MANRTAPSIALGVLGALLTLSAGAPAQTPLTTDQVLARYAEARGGLERWRAVRSLELAGIYTSFSENSPFSIQKQRPGLYRFEFDTLKAHVVHGHDTSAWWIQPLYGIDWAWRAPEPDAGQIARESEFEPALIDAAKKGHKVTLAGPADVDGQPTLKLDVELASGRREVWHLDPTTFLEVAVDAKMVDFTQGPRVWDERSYFSDFRAVEGLVIPHHVEKEYGARHAVFAVERVRVDPELAADRFQMPLSTGMAAIQGLAGDWQLKVETRSDPRAPFSAVATTSSIEPLFGGAALQERLDYTLDGSRARIVRTYTFDRIAGVYRLTSVDDFSAVLNVLEGTMADGKLVASNEKSGTFLKFGEQAVRDRQTISGIGPGGFTIEWERSLDDGKTWFVADRLTYTRKKG